MSSTVARSPRHALAQGPPPRRRPSTNDPHATIGAPSTSAHHTTTISHAGGPSPGCASTNATTGPITIVSANAAAGSASDPRGSQAETGTIQATSSTSSGHHSTGPLYLAEFTILAVRPRSNAGNHGPPRSAALAIVVHRYAATQNAALASSPIAAFARNARVSPLGSRRRNAIVP